MTKSIIWAAVHLTGVYCLARYAGDFSTVQAVFLTVLAALSIEASYLRRSAAKRFRPFSLCIKLDYLKILMDAGLLSDESEWAANGVSGDDLFKGVICWVTSYDVDSGTHVIAWPEWKVYTSRLEQSLAQIEVESLPLAAAFPAGCRAGNSSLKAGFAVKQFGNGLHIIMRIDDQWWKERWAGSIASRPSFGEDLEPWNGVINLTLAIIPYAELQYFYDWKPMSWTVSLKQRRHDLKALRWETDYEPEGYYLQGSGISHRYAEVSHEPVDRHL